MPSEPQRSDRRHDQRRDHRWSRPAILRCTPPRVPSLASKAAASALPCVIRQGTSRLRPRPGKTAPARNSRIQSPTHAAADATVHTPTAAAIPRRTPACDPADVPHSGFPQHVRAYEKHRDDDARTARPKDASPAESWAPESPAHYDPHSSAKTPASWKMPASSGHCEQEFLRTWKSK